MRVAAMRVDSLGGRQLFLRAAATERTPCVIVLAVFVLTRRPLLSVTSDSYYTRPDSPPKLSCSALGGRVDPPLA